MAHFAKLDENNNVISVHVVNDDVITVDGIESERKGIEFLTQLHGHTKWKQASYNGKIRKLFPSVDFIYDETFDIFYSPKPFPSWKLNYETAIWEPPIPYPLDDEGFLWRWSEHNQEWIKTDIKSDRKKENIK